MNIHNLQKMCQAQQILSTEGKRRKDLFCESLARNISKKKASIISANVRDWKKAMKKKYDSAFLDRLRLDEEKVDAIVQRIYTVKGLNAGIGSCIERVLLPNGVTLKRIRVPLGVLLFIYESRPEVTIDVVTLAIGSGNACILKAGSESWYTSTLLIDFVKRALFTAGLPQEAVYFIKSKSRRSLYTLLTKTNFIDVVIARGGYAMVQNILKRSRIPVLCHSEGGARIYIDRTGNLEMAKKIVLNAKTSNPSACNSLDTILVHEEISQKFLPELVHLLIGNNITIYGDKTAQKISKEILPATPKTWEEEFLSLAVSIKVVRGVSEALQFISRYTNHHSEGIIAKDKKVIDIFTKSIDAAALFINCSPRLHDGFVFGKGAEVGIATGKLHARGPLGLTDLTTYKWVAYGNGQIRE
ncbi:glutamate-5-semialdehyde dehydrogenase [Candidatus Gottesmanbacteria bacterium]|nr:glutamate-5-semialdehyde dehydrogenase [Candidatus Gottesmanbacteria bacterium]